MTLVLGWVTGIFRGLTNRPNLRIHLNDGPSICCTFNTGRTVNGHTTHRIAISLYLSITNTGTAPTDISGVHVGYHNFTLRRTLRWFWLTESLNSLSDFSLTLGGYVKVYPFLQQINTLAPFQHDTYLPVGKTTGGIVYFEQAESWGSWKPRAKNGSVKVKIRIMDSFGHSHSTVARIAEVELSEARKFSPEFGNSIEKSRIDHPANQGLSADEQ